MTDKPAIHHHMLLERRGGAAAVARSLAAAQRESSWEVTLSCEAREPAPEGGDALGGSPDTVLVEPGRVAFEAPAGAVTHVHATTDWAALLEGFLAAGRKPLLTVHDCSLFTGGCVYPLDCPKRERGCPDPCPRGFADSARVLAVKLDLVRRLKPMLVSPSAWLARQLRQVWPDCRVRVAPNGVRVPLELEDKLAARAAFGIAPQARTALFLAHGGVRAAYKGGGRIEDIFAKLRELAPGTLGVVAGGDESRMVEGLAVFPYLEGERLRSLMRAADVLVYPTLADNHPLVVLESMAQGVPVAAYGVGGVPEQMTDGVEGFVVPPGDEPWLAGACARLLCDQGLARGMGREARARALRHFTVERMALDYWRITEKMAAEALR
ncbi:glycosyltransferase [Fundidesulfovibrio agrisoli]|uniref:glycosyltransferase n=1 Tax=Fundidesulfovibrio agrisoli TaxID=2922717 RepID=UPI001FABF5F7